MVTKSQLQGEVGMAGDSTTPVPPLTHGPYSQDQDMDYKALLQCSGHLALNRKRYCLVDYFAKRPQLTGSIDATYDNATARVCHEYFEIVGTSAADANITFATTIGGLELKTGGTTANQIIVAPHLDADQSPWTSILWGTENQVIWEAVIRTGASVASIIVWAGLKLTNDQAIDTDNDQAYFRFDTGETNWEVVYTVAGASDIELDTGVVVAADTTYYFRIEIDSDRLAHFYINNVRVSVSTALDNDVDLIPYVGVETSTGSAKIINLISQAISRIHFE